MPLDHDLPDRLDLWLNDYLHALPERREPALEAEDGVFALVLMASCRSAGFSVDSAVRSHLARRCGLPLDLLDAAGEFVEHAHDEPETPLRVCRGLQCRMNDGEARANRIVEALGASDRAEEVYCLDRCGLGPNLRCGGLVFQAGIGEVGRDERSWRRPGVRISAEGAPPVRD